MSPIVSLFDRMSATHIKQIKLANDKYKADLMQIYINPKSNDAALNKRPI
jgi:hypothetical protein